MLYHIYFGKTLYYLIQTWYDKDTYDDLSDDYNDDHNNINIPQWNNNPKFYMIQQTQIEIKKKNDSSPKKNLFFLINHLHI